MSVYVFMRILIYVCVLFMRVLLFTCYNAAIWRNKDEYISLS